jgi:outer membrane protein assembly factor BamE (lipoprotein component of BamABCDE complex)
MDAGNEQCHGRSSVRNIAGPAAQEIFMPSIRRQSSKGRVALAIGLVAMAMATGGCTRIRTHQGYVVDKLLVDSVQPGIDNKASVEGTLGRPTFATQFGTEEWYYVSRDMRQLAFSNPRPSGQTVLHITFDQAGNVAKIDRTGLEQIARISPSGDKTPTLGRHRSLFNEIFGNIGAVGAGGMGGGAGQTGPGPNGS